ncbi:MAG TPA: VOC family protein [Candidatus Angelobacter sp.]|nr:VOC family protein [Candidatus Angelobacter sp.]
MIWIHRVDPQRGLVSARSLLAQPGGLVVIVDDVEAHYHRAKSAGASTDSTPTDQPYGQREYRLGTLRETYGTSRRGYVKKSNTDSQVDSEIFVRA